MKILITTPIFSPRTGGPATYIWELANRLKQKHHITIVCFSANPDSIQGVKIIPVNPCLISPIRQLILFIQIIKNTIRQDVVYIQGPLVVGLVSFLAAKCMAKKTLLKYVGDEIWETQKIAGKTTLSLTDFYTSNHSFATTLLIQIQRFVLRSVDKIITPSKFLKKTLIKIHHLDPQKIAHINNAIEVSAKKNKKNPHQLIYVGRLVPWKNIDQTIIAVGIARQQKPWNLLVVGEGPQKKELKNLATKLKLSSHIKFLGRQSREKTRQLIAQSQKLILYSDYEGLSHTLIEAMLFKVPIITSNIQPNREVTDGHAQFVELNNPQKLASAINTKTKFSADAYWYAKKHYSWQRHIKDLAKLFQ